MSAERTPVPDQNIKKVEPKIVTCPHCNGESIYQLSNSARPFCSPKCKALDLGAWANEDFRLVENMNNRDATFVGSETDIQ